MAAACGGGATAPTSRSAAPAEPAAHALVVRAGPVTLTIPATKRAVIATATGSRRKLLERWVLRRATVVRGRGWNTHLRWSGPAVAAVRAPATEVHPSVTVRSRLTGNDTEAAIDSTSALSDSSRSCTTFMTTTRSVTPAATASTRFAVRRMGARLPCESHDRSFLTRIAHSATT